METILETILEPEVPTYYFQVNPGGQVVCATITNAPAESDIEVSEELYSRFSAGSKFRWNGEKFVTYEPEPPALTQRDYSDAIQRHLDDKARERHYDGIQSAISYRGDANPQYAAEAEDLFLWRSQVWTYATQELSKVMLGEREQPTVQSLIGELPTFMWPTPDADQLNMF